LDDPVAATELDELYTALGMTSKRCALLQKSPADSFASSRLIIERRADLACATGHPKDAIRLLEQTPWPREHQRYVRTELWRKAKAALGEPDAPVPDFLNEDNLARFGAYWSEPEQTPDVRT
jgi:hypothetical protein